MNYPEERNNSISEERTAQGRTARNEKSIVLLKLITI
jgi:hypothetical protein